MCKEGWPRGGCSPRPEPSVPRAGGLAPPRLLVTELPRTGENPGKAEQRPLPPPLPAPARATPPPTPPQETGEDLGTLSMSHQVEGSVPILGQRVAVAPTPSPFGKTLRDGAEARERGQAAASGPSRAWSRPSAARPPRYRVLPPGRAAAGRPLRPPVLSAAAVLLRQVQRVAESGWWRGAGTLSRGWGRRARVGCWAAGREAGAQ